MVNQAAEAAKAATEILAKPLSDHFGWPKELALSCAESFVATHLSEEGLQFYGNLPLEQQRELWYYFASGWNKGRLLAKLPNN